MASSSWKGFISFGLISVPIRLFAAARESHVRFHEIHRECGTRVHQQLYCPYDKRVVSRDEIAMGYEVDEDKYILVDRAELKKVEPPSSTAMEIQQFVKLDEVDPVYFETSYFAVPDEPGRRAYALLLRTMESRLYGAVAKVTMHQREQTVVLRPYKNGLIVHTLFYPEEIREASGYGKSSGRELKKEEVRLSEQFAEYLLKPFDPSQFHDEYKERVIQLIEAKRKGKPEPVTEKLRKLAPVVDLASALRQSLGQVQKKPPVRARTRKRTKAA